MSGRELTTTTKLDIICKSDNNEVPHFASGMEASRWKPHLKMLSVHDLVCYCSKLECPIWTYYTDHNRQFSSKSLLPRGILPVGELNYFDAGVNRVEDHLTLATECPHQAVCILQQQGRPYTIERHQSSKHTNTGQEMYETNLFAPRYSLSFWSLSFFVDVSAFPVVSSCSGFR